MSILFKTGVPGTQLPFNFYVDGKTFQTPFLAGSMDVIEKYSCPPQMHAHPGIELFVLTGGKGTFYYDGEYYDLKPFDCYFINAMVPHGITAGEKISSVYFHINEQLLSSIVPPEPGIKLLRLFYMPFTHGSNVLGNCKKIAELLVRANKLSFTQDEFDRVLAWNCTVEAMVDIARVVFPQQAPLSTQEKIDKKKFLSIVHYIHTHFHEPLKIEHLARTCGMGRTHFYTLFCQSMHCTPHDYISRVKIGNVLRLLTSSDQKVEWIARSCGFTNLPTFYSLFKKVTGKLPNQVRTLNNI